MSDSLFKDSFDEDVNEIIESSRPSGYKPVKGQMPKPQQQKRNRSRTKKPLHPDAEFAIKKGLQEIEQINTLFEAFCKEIEGLALHKYCNEALEEIRTYMKKLIKLLIHEFDTSKLDDYGLKALQKVQKHRAEILTDLFNHYHEEF